MTDTPDLPEGAAKDKKLPPDAIRALEEAAARRKEAERVAAEAEKTKEFNGPRGLEPTRNGDWERKGIAYDF